jgi:hypothetical protein
MRHALSLGYDHIAALTPLEKYIVCSFRHTSIRELFILGHEDSPGWVPRHFMADTREEVEREGVTITKRCILLIQFLTVRDTNNLIVNIKFIKKIK